MNKSAGRLATAALLFFGWIGYLAYQSRETGLPVLSRPQFLISNLDVLAEVVDRNARPVPLRILEVYWPPDANDLAGRTITVGNLDDTVVQPTRPEVQAEPFHRDTGQTYLLPLQQTTKGDYLVAPLPPSPGFLGGAPQVYRVPFPVPSGVRKQLAALPKPR